MNLPVLCKVSIFLRHRISNPSQCLKEYIMLLFVGISLTRFTTGQELLFFIIKVITEDISIEIEKINIIRLLREVLKCFEEDNMLIIKSFVLK